jgi:hypothetical protein
MKTLFDKVTDVLGIALALIGAIVLIGVILIWVIVKTLQLLAMVLVGLLLAGAIVLMVWATIHQMLDN